MLSSIPVFVNRSETSVMVGYIHIDLEGRIAGEINDPHLKALLAEGDMVEFPRMTADITFIPATNAAQ